MLDLLKENYKLLSYFEDGNFNNLQKSGFAVDSFGNHELSTPIDSDKAVSKMLSDRDFMKREISNLPNKNLALFFYMSQQMDSDLRKTGLNMALPDYKIQEKIGNKLFLNKICSDLDIDVNRSLSFSKDRCDPSVLLKRCVSDLGLPFIVQGDLGVSGEDTFIINSEQDFISYLPRLSDQFKASRFIRNNLPLSVHICVTKDRTFYEGPYIQIIGFKDLAKNPFQFSGNDTSQKIIKEDVKEIIYDISLKISDLSRRNGYLGILGIDFLWNLQTGKVYVQEINSRLVGLTRLLTGIQKEQKVIPDLVRHINEFTKLQIDKSYRNEKVDLSRSNYSQIYISHNSDDEVLVKKYLLPGIYKIIGNGLVRTKNSLFVSDMNSDEILVNFSIYGGVKLHADQVIFKIILKSSVLVENKYELSKNLIRIIKLLKAKIL